MIGTEVTRGSAVGSETDELASLSDPFALANLRIAHAIHSLAQEYLLYPHKGSEQDYLIINDPHRTLQHDLLGVDMEKVMQNIFEVCEQKPSSRQKPLLAVVTGKGRGKTRLLVEIDKCIREHHAEDTLSISITFNHHWTSIERLRDNAFVDYAFAIACRILSMHFRIPLDHVHVHLKRKLKEVSDDDLECHRLEIIRETLRAIVGQCRANGHHVRRLVFSVDEALQAEDEFGRGVHGDLRRALLNDRLLPDLDVALVMTSLGLGPLGITDSGRAVLPLTAPMVALSPIEVLERWIPKYLPDLVLDDSQRLAVLSFIASLSSLPRGIQYLVQSMQEIRNKRGLPFVLDDATFQFVYNKTAEKLRNGFSLDSRSVSLRCLHALLFKKKLPLEEQEVQDLLTSSVFTNTVTSLIVRATIEPSTCSMSLFEVLKSKDFDSETAKVLCKMLETFLSPLYNAHVPEGQALEVILRGLLEARLTVLGELAEMEGGKKNIPLHAMLLLNSLTNIGNLKTFKRAKRLLLTQIEINGPPEESSLSRSTYLSNGRSVSDASAGFFTDALSIFVSDESPCVKLNLHEQECADSGWLLKTSTGALCIVIDAKSVKVDESDLNGYAKNLNARPRALPDAKQAEHFADLCDVAAEMVAAGMVPADPYSLIGAMQAKNYLYVYLNTRNLPSVVMGENVFNLGGKDSAKFLSFMYDYCILHRVVPQETK